MMVITHHTFDLQLLPRIFGWMVCFSEIQQHKIFKKQLSNNTGLHVVYSHYFSQYIRAIVHFVN